MATLSYALRWSVKERALLFMICRVMLSVIQCPNVKPVLVLLGTKPLFKFVLSFFVSCWEDKLLFDSSQHHTYMQSAAPVKHWTERTDTTVGIFPPSGLCSRRLCSPPHIGQLLSVMTHSEGTSVSSLVKALRAKKCSDFDCLKP